MRVAAHNHAPTLCTPTHPMATQRGNPDQHLQKVGGTYYARVRVARTLEKYVGQSHVRRSLKTGDKVEANRRKHAVVAQIKAELEAIRKAPGRPQERGISFAEARAWRDDLKAAEDADANDEDDESFLRGTVLDHLIDRAAEVERLYGKAKAARWVKAATTDDKVAEPLADLMGKWLEVSDYKPSTNSGHRRALAEVLKFLGDDQAIASEVTRQKAMAFIDNDLTRRSPGLSHSTIRDRLVSLAGFWSWLVSRDEAVAGSNPWTGHKISKQTHKGRSPEKRAYTDDEMLRLMAGNDQVKSWPTYAYTPDLIVLGMFTGARLESLCALRVDAIEHEKTQSTLTITNDKNVAGNRLVGITHPAPLAVLRRRTSGKKGQDLLFPELRQGGLDDKFSSSVTKAFGRYRRACAVPDGTDFHSYRRNVITVLEAASVGQVPIARFVGHKVGTVAADTYSTGGAKLNSLKTSRKVRYSANVEAAAVGLAA